MTLRERFVRWLLPKYLFCPCLECTMERAHNSDHIRLVKVEPAHEPEPTRPTKTALTNPGGAMYHKQVLH